MADRDETRVLPAPGTSLGLTGSRGSIVLASAVVLLLAAAVAAWFTTHPSPLPQRADAVSASTPVGTPVYVGVFSAPADLGRSLEVAGVHVYTEASVPVTVTPLLCKAGSISATSDLTPFCDEVVPTAGAVLEPGDTVVVEVSGEKAGAAYVNRVQVSFREGLRWGSSPAGRPAVVTIAERDG